MVTVSSQDRAARSSAASSQGPRNRRRRSQRSRKVRDRQRHDGSGHRRGGRSHAGTRSGQQADAVEEGGRLHRMPLLYRALLRRQRALPFLISRLHATDVTHINRFVNAREATAISFFAPWGIFRLDFELGDALKDRAFKHHVAATKEEAEFIQRRGGSRAGRGRVNRASRSGTAEGSVEKGRTSSQGRETMQGQTEGQTVQAPASSSEEHRSDKSSGQGPHRPGASRSTVRRGDGRRSTTRAVHAVRLQ